MKVFKYKLARFETVGVLLPSKAEPLSIGVQNSDIVMWVLVDPNKSHHRVRHFHTAPTGVNIPISHVFIGTAQMENGLVFHVFETTS